MHVLIITQYFPPEVGASASRWGDYSSIFADQNHKVTVLCESPNYPQGSVYKGYSNSWLEVEKRAKNLTVMRTKAYASDRKTTLKKLIHYFVFMFSAMINFKKVKNYDLLIISSPPLFTAAIGLVIKKIYKQDFWLDVRDLWPDSALKLNQIKKGIFYSLGKFLEKKIYKSAKGFMYPVPGFKKYFLTFNDDISKKPMISLMNGVSREFIETAKSMDIKVEKKFIVLYSGNMGLAQDLKTIIKSAELLSSYEIYFQFIGEGVCRDQIYNLSKNLGEKIEFHKSMKRKKLIERIKKSSVCLVPLKNKKLFRNALPSKMFEYMACQKPIITSVVGHASTIVNSNKCGISILPENPEELAQAILTYYNNSEKLLEYGTNGMSYVTKNLEKEVLASNLIEEVQKHS